MGWGQPVAPGKRVHSSTHENSSSSDSKQDETEELSDPPPYCSKRAREISPELDRVCNGNGGIMPESAILCTEVSINGDGELSELKSAVVKEEEEVTAAATSNGCDNNTTNSTGNASPDEATTEVPSVPDAGSDSDSTIRTSILRNPNDVSANPNGKVSQKGVRVSQTRKGPRVLASKRFTRSSLRKSSALRKSSTAQSLTSSAITPTDLEEDEDEDSDESEVFLDSVHSEKTESSDCNSVSSSSTGITTSTDSSYDTCGGDSIDSVPKVTVQRIIPAIRPSYFPFVPPYINFCMHDEKTDQLPEEIRKLLKWRLSPITPIVVKRTVSNSGYRLLRKTVEWEGQWGKHMKASMFRASLKDFQKLNHIPGSFQVGRKDRLWRNLHRYMNKFGKEEFGFLPRTFLLPSETKQLKAAWDSMEGKNTPWIVKPPAAARGTGIRVINKWNQVPKKKPVIVQSYVANPYLINDRKFDLRLYVLVTDFNPLKIYMYNDGLVRFAPVKYSNDSKRVGDRFMHLTNYSVNKNCELYTHNEDAEACEGHKWTLKTLWRYLKDRNVDIDTLWERMEEIVVKTLLCPEELINNTAHCIPNRYSCYELFGFDIIIDEDLKPWLLEVNISPSLHSSSPLDIAVKGPLIKEVFNIVGFHVPHKLSAATKKKFLQSLDVQLELETPVFDKRLYTNILNKDEKQKHLAFKPHFLSRDKYLDTIIEALTPDDIRQLILAEDELSQCDGFTRIFPGPNTYTYFPYFETSRYYNMLFDAWETKYGNNRLEGVERLTHLCRNKIHLDVEPSALNATSESQDCDVSEADKCNANDPPARSSVEQCQTEASDDNCPNSNSMEVEVVESEINVVATEGKDSQLNNVLENGNHEQLSSQTTTTTPSASDLENANFLAPSTPTPTIPLVLDNITNSPRSLMPDVFANSPTIKCHDEDRLAVGPANTQMQQPIGDYIKGICF